MKHLSWDQIWDYVDGEATADHAAIQLHLDTCGSCGKMLNAVQVTNSAIRAAYRLFPERPSSTSVGTIQRSEMFGNMYLVLYRRGDVTSTRLFRHW